MCLNTSIGNAAWEPHPGPLHTVERERFQALKWGRGLLARRRVNSEPGSRDSFQALKWERGLVTRAGRLLPHHRRDVSSLKWERGLLAGMTVPG